MQVAGTAQKLVDYASSSSGQCSSADVSLSQSGAYTTMLDRLQVRFVIHSYVFALLLSRNVFHMIYEIMS